MILVIAVALIVASCAAEAAAHRRRIVCQDGGDWVVRKPGMRDLPCDADQVTDGRCTITYKCQLGLRCPPCCGETIVVPVGTTVRLPPWGFGYRFHCRRSAE